MLLSVIHVIVITENTRSSLKLKWQCLLFFQTPYRLVLKGKRLLGLKTEGIRALDCDKQPVAGEGGVVFGGQLQEHWHLSKSNRQR